MSKVQEPAVSIKPSYRLAEFCRDFGIGRSLAYELIKAGSLKTFKVGRTTLIAGEDALAWRDSCRTRAA